MNYNPNGPFRIDQKNSKNKGNKKKSVSLVRTIHSRLWTALATIVMKQLTPEAVCRYKSALRFC